MPSAQLFLSGLEPIINRTLALDPASQARIDALKGKRLIVWLDELPWPIEFVFQDTVSLHQYMESWDVASAQNRDNECRLKLALDILPTLQDSRQITRLIREGKLDLDGDIHIAQQASALAQQLSIDWEDILSDYVGDVAAYELSQFARSAKQKLSMHHESIMQTLGAALIDEKRLAAHKLHVMHFNDQVSDVRDAVERLSARISRLEER